MKHLWPLAFILLIIGCLLIITGCSDRTEPLAVIGAPAVLRNWSPEEECALAQALAPVPSDSVLWTLHDDWARMRRESGLLPPKKKTNCRTTTTGTRLLS
jgi:hypothetical protein